MRKFAILCISGTAHIHMLTRGRYTKAIHIRVRIIFCCIIIGNKTVPTPIGSVCSKFIYAKKRNTLSMRCIWVGTASASAVQSNTCVMCMCSTCKILEGQLLKNLSSGDIVTCSNAVYSCFIPVGFPVSSKKLIISQVANDATFSVRYALRLAKLLFH